MDLEQIREWLSTLGSLAIGGGTIWLAYTGNAFRKDKQFEHKFNTAREAIRVFNCLRNDIRQIRSPATYEGELIELEKLPEDNQLITGMKKAGSRGGVTLLRLDKRSENFSEMNRLEPEFRAFFGDTAAFSIIRQIHGEISGACHVLTNQTLKESKESEKYISTIWSVSPNDEINTRANDAVDEIEKICCPVLSGRKNKND